MRALLEVLASAPGDAAGAQSGGADRLLLAAAPGSGERPDRTPPPALVRAVAAETDLPVRAVLCSGSAGPVTGAEVSALQGAAEELAAAGAAGLELGLLGPTLELDVDAVTAVLAHGSGLPWTFSRALDAALDHGRAWRAVRHLPGLDAVRTAGSTRGLEDGLDDLCARASADPDVARLVLAGGGLLPEHVPWLLRAGVRSYAVASRARPDRSWRAYVDAGHVRSWRTLLDDALAAAL